MSENLFEGTRATPERHFTLYFYAAVLHLIEQLSYAFDSWEEVVKQFPFLEGYYIELARNGAEGMTLPEAAETWRDSLRAWEQSAREPLPLRALGLAAGLGYEELALLLTAGMCEADSRFAFVFETLQGVSGRSG